MPNPNFEYLNRKNLIQRKGEQLSKEVFVGGGVKKFEVAGRTQLINMLQTGLYPNSKVLDIGCGCLRGGYWLISFLNPECYFGIEPNKKMLEAGISVLLDSETLDRKRPRFANNDDFDFSVFGESFDFYIARSIWTHAPKQQIETMLDSFVATRNDDAVFLASILRPGFKDKNDYKGDRWVGKSHECDVAGTVAHSLEWIEEACRSRGLASRLVDLPEHGLQEWLYITDAG